MSKNKILIVEDERITAEDLKNTLENMGYEVTGVASSEDSFYKSLNESMPDLVLMDIYLKGNKDGIELATDIKEKYQLPVIYLTAYFDSNILERAKITEPFGFILKPFQERELHSNIEMALHKNRMEKHISHLNATLKAIREVNQIIVRVLNTKELLQKTCETLISTKAYKSAWFMVIDQKGDFQDAAFAGQPGSDDSFINQLKNDFQPDCIERLNKSNEHIYSLKDCQKCSGCSSYNKNQESGAIVSKVQYQDRLFGYLNVAMPQALVDDQEELSLIVEISDDLGHALNNLEQLEEKEKAEIALHESEIRFRHAFDFAATSMFIISVDGKFMKTNVAFRKLTGYSENELKQMHFNDITFPEDQLLSLNYLSKLTNGEIEKAGFEKRYISKTKNAIWAYVSSSLVRDELNQPKFFITHLVDLTERKLAEEKQKNSEEQLRTLINAMPDLVCFKDGNGRWLVANDYALKLFGLEGVDYFGKTDKELAGYSNFYSEVFLNCEETDSIAWKKGVMSRQDRTLIRRDGTHMIFDSIKIPRFDSNGMPKGLVIVERDITERKHSEQELQKLSQVVKQSPVAIVVTNTNGDIEYANPAACHVSGYTIEELIGENPRMLKSGETPAEEYKLMWETIMDGNEWKGDFHNRKKNGQLYWERASISPIKNLHGEITHFLGIKEDITEQKHSENIQKVLFNISKQVFETTNIHQLLEIVKNELSSYIDTRNFYVAFYKEETGMLTTEFDSDEKDTIESWPAEKSLTGYVVKHNKSILLRKADIQKLFVAGELEQVGTESEVWLGVPLVANGKAYGAIVIQDYHNANAFNENELKMLEFIASQVSLSIQREKSILDLQDAFAKAEAGDKLKTAFINNISHEIRTPLNGILGFTEMTLNPDSTREDNELFFSIIKKSSKRLLSTITSYMDISMLVSGTMELVRRPSNLDKLIKEVYADFVETAASKGIELKTRKPEYEEPLVLNTDAEKLRKILIHLLDNAFKFTLKGTVTFGYEIKDNDIEFFVRDTGTGIKTEAMNLIFDAFMQADVSSTRGYEGSGLGLSIANGLVKLLGGNFRVDTERGRGSTFYFTIPLNENPVLTTRKTVEAPKPEPSDKPLILVAEDDDSNYKYIEIVLLYASYSVIRAENGIEAVDCCRNNPKVRLVLMDIKMPLMDGFEATRQIRKFLPDLPVIALTAHVTTEDENMAISSGCSEYVTKPVSKAKLLEIIEESLALS